MRFEEVRGEAYRVGCAWRGHPAMLLVDRGLCLMGFHRWRYVITATVAGPITRVPGGPPSASVGAKVEQVRECQSCEHAEPVPWTRWHARRAPRRVPPR